jgi:phage FluMu gp28-like protein
VTGVARKPHFLPYQRRYLADKSRLKITEKSRRIGWTYIQAYEDVQDASKVGGMDVWFTSADLTAAREYMRYVQLWAKILNVVATDLGEVVLDGEGESAIKAFVTQFANGKRITALSSNPKGFRSKGGKVVIDEFAFHEQADELWRAAAPSVLWGYPIRVFSSHNGKNNRFYRMVQEAQQPGSRWSAHKVTIEDAIGDGLVERIQNLERPATGEELDAFRAECRAIAGDEETYQQEFLCNPLDGSAAYIPYGLVEANTHPAVPAPLVLRGADLHATPLDLYRPAPTFVHGGGRLYLGVDIGRRHDLTVLWLGERLNGVLWTRLVVELHAVRFRYQFRWLQALLPLVAHTEIDEGGLGMQLAEDAETDFGAEKVTRVSFTMEAKRDLSVGLKRELEDQTLRLPDAESVRTDIGKIRRHTTPSGNVVFQGERDADGHADRYWALALMRRASTRTVGGGLITL